MASDRQQQMVRDYLLQNWSPYHRGSCGRCKTRESLLYKATGDPSGLGVCMTCVVRLRGAN